MICTLSSCRTPCIHSFMKLLVIGSCTKSKDVGNCPRLLLEPDFANPTKLAAGERRLSDWILPAASLYTGLQHRYMMNGVEHLRSCFGKSACTVKIISAGYGLVDEVQRLAPYEVTFSHKSSTWIRERASRLGIPSDVRSAIRGYDAIIFLLGKEYLWSTDLPLPQIAHGRLIFFSSDQRTTFGTHSTVVPAGGPEGTRFSVKQTALKGRMFEWLAEGLCSKAELWKDMLADDSPATATRLIELGRRQ